jgi:PAS domain-containing protein
MKKTRHSQIPARVTEIIPESISDGVFTVDHGWRITSFTRAAEEITGCAHPGIAKMARKAKEEALNGTA